jgi:hypothetical protein
VRAIDTLLCSVAHIHGGHRQARGIAIRPIASPGIQYSTKSTSATRR